MLAPAFPAYTLVLAIYTSQARDKPRGIDMHDFFDAIIERHVKVSKPNKTLKLSYQNLTYAFEFERRLRPLRIASFWPSTRTWRGIKHTSSFLHIVPCFVVVALDPFRRFGPNVPSSASMSMAHPAAGKGYGESLAFICLFFDERVQI